MNTKIHILAIASVLFGSAISGCVGKEESVTVKPSPTSSPVTEPAKGSALGTEVQGEHYAIKLESEPVEPKVGKVKFTATVLHHGTPTETAKVMLTTSMPAMGHGGPEAEMKHVGAGVYTAEIELAMAGETQARITVDQEGHLGEATFDFVAQN
jgi:hypothetical protein